VKPAFSITALVASATAVFALNLALATPAQAAPQLRFPDLSHLQAKAVETVNVDVGGFLLGLARAFTRDEARNDPAIRLLDDIESVKVRSFKFDSDDAYSHSDLDSLRKQLQAPEWNAIATIHKREPREDVDVYICFDDDKACGIAVIAAQARELTIVNVVGNVDIDRLAELEGEFGIPKVSNDQ
jgi:hypothetical protein